MSRANRKSEEEAAPRKPRAKPCPDCRPTPGWRELVIHQRIDGQDDLVSEEVARCGCAASEGYPAALVDAAIVAARKLPGFRALHVTSRDHPYLTPSERLPPAVLRLAHDRARQGLRPACLRSEADIAAAFSPPRRPKDRWADSEW
jgi:hypothetical protein